MIISLTGTTTSGIADAIRRAHAHTGTSAMAFTLVAVTDAEHRDAVFDACLQAGGEHPSRILVVVREDGSEPVLDATVRSGEGVPGDIVTLHLSGALAEHAEQVVLPLLLPDSPVVVWWPHDAPTNPAEDPVGALAIRRITDASGEDDPVSALHARAEHTQPGDTDLSWTRLTPWRALLAAGVDQHPARITHATIEAAADNAPAELMDGWLRARLGVEVERIANDGPGITAVRLSTTSGDIALQRPGSGVACYEVPGQPTREVALKRRDINELITEELRRMDADEIFEEATRTLPGRRALKEKP